MPQMPRIPTQKHLCIPLCFPGPLVAPAWPCVCPHPNCGNLIVPLPASETLSLVFSPSLDTSAQKEQCHNPQYDAHTMGKALGLSIPAEPTEMLFLTALHLAVHSLTTTRQGEKGCSSSQGSCPLDRQGDEHTAGFRQTRGVTVPPCCVQPLLGHWRPPLQPLCSQGLAQHPCSFST